MNSLSQQLYYRAAAGRFDAKPCYHVFTSMTATASVPHAEAVNPFVRLTATAPPSFDQFNRKPAEDMAVPPFGYD